jgi:ribosomal-protein-alanine N-acetyltransferase
MCEMRELTDADAESLFTHLATEEVARFISPPPTSVEGFRAFIAWAHRQREAGHYLCYGVVPVGQRHAVGVFQIARHDDRSGELGFALGSGFWGTGVFAVSARRLLRFAFTGLGVERLEARSLVVNARGNGALRKVGATLVGLLRGAFERGGERFDQYQWRLTRASWREECKERQTHRPRCQPATPAANVARSASSARRRLRIVRRARASRQSQSCRPQRPNPSALALW